MTDKTPAELIVETQGLLKDYQTESEVKIKAYGEKQVETDETLKNMETKFAELSENLQTIADSDKKKEEDIKNLELTVARAEGAAESKEGEIKTTPEIKAAFYNALHLPAGQMALKAEDVETNVREHINHMLKHLPEAKKELLIKNLMAEGSDPAGGMWCPVPMDSRIRRRMFETSPMRDLATVMNVSSQAMEFALDDEEAEASETGEVGTRAQTDTPDWGKVRIDVDELYAYPKATLQLLEDSIFNIESWLAGKVSRRFSRKQNTAFVSGDGVQQAKGILHYADAGIEVYERSKIGTTTTATANTLVGDDLIDLQSHLLEDYQPNATWAMHRLIWASIMKLKDTVGQYLLNPAVLFQGAVPQLLGAPVRMFGDMPSLTSGSLVDNQFIAVYGDFREAYTILDRLGINVIRDNITSPGFVKWNFRTRYGGGVTNFQALKRLKSKAA